MDDFNYIPYSLQNIFGGSRSPTSIRNNTIAYYFWCRVLYQRLCSVIEFKLPDSWSRARDLFEACLFYKGFLAVFDTDDFGIAFQPAQINGYDFYYQPTDVIISNPKYSKSLKIGSDAELIKLTNDFKGVCDSISYYAEKLATIDGAVNMAIINSKLAYVFGAKNKAGAQAVKLIFDKINRGEPTIVYDKQIFDGLGDEEPFTFLDRASIKNSYITTDLLKDQETILNQFNREIGIPAVPEKRERMITDEANLLTADSSARITLWDECLKNSIKVVNDRFGLNISYRFRFLDNDISSNESEESAEDAEIKKRILTWASQN